MQGMAILGGAVLLSSTFLSSAVSAQSVDELRAQIEELTQKVEQIQVQRVATPVIAPAQAVTAGDFPGSIKLPGTNTSFKVGGYVKFDMHYTTQQGIGDSYGAAAIAVPGQNPVTLAYTNPAQVAQAQSDGHTRLHARQTRFNIQTRTPSDFGQVRTYIEGDFEGGGGNEVVSNSSGLRLRHAYGTLGNLLVGQTWGNFMILGALADTVDFAGPAGVWFSRQAQIRYTVPFGGGWKVEGSIENPQAAVIAGVPFGAASFSGVGSGDDTVPDFVAKVTYGGSWGFLSLGAKVGVYDVNTLATNPAGSAFILDDEEVFFAIHGGGRINTWGKDSIGFTASYNDGGGRTLVPFGTPSAYVEINAATGVPDIETIEWIGFNAHYEHWWADNLYSVAAYGITDIDYPNQVAPAGTIRPSFIGFTETVQSVHVNLQWIPVPRVTLAIEYILGIEDIRLSNAFAAAGADDDGTIQRVQLGAKFAF
jgi:outer membrane murein-binding lipoprotein Lpp